MLIAKKYPFLLTFIFIHGFPARTVKIIETDNTDRNKKRLNTDFFADI